MVIRSILHFIIGGTVIAIALLVSAFSDNRNNKGSVADIYGDSLAINFKNPPAEFTILPFWSLNNTLDTAKLNWQLDQMMDKGIYGAFMHARDGLDLSETPYFSTGWWDAIVSTVKHAHEKGFFACLYDEDKWPSGSAGGRTIAANPEEYIKKGLHYITMELVGPQTIHLDFSVHPLAIYAGKLSPRGVYDFSSQQNLTGLNGKEWKVPQGRWSLVVFDVVKDPERQIDYLDTAAVAEFFHVTHEEYYKRLKPYFGNTIPGVFFDEIHANLSNRQNNMFWTDDFPAQFKNLKGYDLNDYLPLLVYDDPNHSPTTRYDFFDVVRTLYNNAWFRKYAQWTNDHHIWVTGHTTELMSQFNRQSDYFNTMGQLQRPCTDNEDFRYGFPRRIDWYMPKQMSSIGHIYGSQRVAAESMGGGGYTIPLEEYRNGFAMLGVYGVNMFVPHLFHYSMDRPENQADWPPSWFYNNPYWKYFKPLATYAQRISYMISQGQHVSDIAILYPLTQLWLGAYSSPVNDEYYREIQRQLLNNHIDYDVIDPTSLLKAGCSDSGMQIGSEHYKVIILPDLQAIQSDEMAKLSDFAAKGGIVISLNRIPSASEKSEPDPFIVKTATELFGFQPAALRQNEYYSLDKKGEHNYIINAYNKGKGIFSRYVEELPGILKQAITEDIQVEGPDDEWLRFQHRKVGERDVFFFVNSQNKETAFKISFKNIGQPYLWHPETGDISEINNYRVNNGRLELMQQFGPNEAFFIVFEPGSIRQNNLLVKATDLKNVKLIYNNDQLTINGWSSGGPAHEVEVWKGEDLITKKWNGSGSLPELLLTGSWDFQLSPHSLDYKWSAALMPDTVALPVMKFKMENRKNEGRNIRSGNIDEKGWKLIKVEDSYSNVKGCQRYLSDWNGVWINYYDYSRHLQEINGGTKYFRRELNIEGTPTDASLDITADENYELYINGKLVGKDSEWKTVEHYIIKDKLVAGHNSILVKTGNSHGLLLEGSYKLKNGDAVSFYSDSTWQASPDTLNWTSAFCYVAPPLGVWGNISRPGHSIHFPATVWYRQVLPPGAKMMVEPMIKGNYEVYVNGRLVHFNERHIADISSLANDEKNIVSIRVRIDNYSDGLQQPVKVVCGKLSVPLQPWNDLGLGWYSGRALYNKTLNLPEKYIASGTRLMLDLGEVNYFAEIWVNDQLVKYCPWAPFKADITKYVHAGKNDITIVVANLLANEASWNMLDANIDNKSARWWHYGSIMREKEKLISGLPGPVKIIPLINESIKLNF